VRIRRTDPLETNLVTDPSDNFQFRFSKPPTPGRAKPTTGGYAYMQVNPMIVWCCHVEKRVAAPTWGEGAPESGVLTVGENVMKFMLMMNCPRDGYDQYLAWPKDVLAANVAFMRAFGRKLSASGELVGAEGLASPKQAKLVRAGADGRPITDGVFPESKEFLAGYWLVAVASRQRAYEIAAEASTAPGIGDAPLVIEVREVMSRAPPSE
jgi:hypothetical protein